MAQEQDRDILVLFFFVFPTIQSGNCIRFSSAVAENGK